jgi:hypothetical protein
MNTNFLLSHNCLNINEKNNKQTLFEESIDEYLNEMIIII